jgi:hypothetical protein
MKIQCPHCGVNGSADDLYQGLRVKCPKCQGIFVAAGEITPAPPHHPAAAEVPAGEPVGTGSLAGQEALAGAGDAGPAMAGPVAEDKAEIVEEIEVTIDPAVEPAEVPAWADIAADIDRQIIEDDKPPASPVDEDRTVAAALDPSIEEEKSSAVSGTPESSEISPAAPSKFTEMDARLAELDAAAIPAPDGIERQPYGMDKELCWQCGKKDSIGVPFIAKDGRLYCPDCVPAAEAATDRTAGPDAGTADTTDDSTPEARYGFTVGGVLREAWAKTKGAKAAVWAGSAVMYLVQLALFAGGSLLLLSSTTPGGTGSASFVGEMLFFLIIIVVSVIFVAGLLFMGIRRVAGERISWNMVFRGFSMAGKIIVATILQSLLVGIGFMLLVLPGIYLAIGYAMTIPLIIDRQMSPWQAMEASRQAIHREWWKIAGIFLVMTLIYNLSMVPLGIGLIWSWPMFIIVAGVVYRSLFGIEKKNG